MLVVCAGKALKQPIEFEIPDEEYEKIQKLGTAELQNQRIAALAIRHIKKYGYDLGSCDARKRSVDFNFCIGCGQKQGQSKSEWEACKRAHLTYKYPTGQAAVKSIKAIKDEKINKKLELTPEELVAAKNLFITDK